MNKKNQDQIISLLHIDTSIEDLNIEADTVFKLLCAYSDRIQKLEICLKEKCANFPFKSLITKDEKSQPKPIEFRHKVNSYKGTLEAYISCKSWYFSWEKDEVSKSGIFRLFLICEEKEIGFAGSHESYIDQEFPEKCIYRKAFSDTDLDTKLKYIRYMYSYLDAFKEYLREIRLSIENSQLPTDNELSF